MSIWVTQHHGIMRGKWSAVFKPAAPQHTGPRRLLEGEAAGGGRHTQRVTHHGQWWSIFSTQWPHMEQWCARGGRTLRHLRHQVGS